MGKLRTKSGNEFEVENIELQNGDTLRFTAIGIKEYDVFRETLTKAELSDVKAYTGKTLTADYGSYPGIVFPINIAEQENGTLKVTVTLRKENEDEKKILSLEKAVNKLILTGLGVQ